MFPISSEPVKFGVPHCAGWAIPYSTTAPTGDVLHYTRHVHANVYITVKQIIKFDLFEMCHYLPVKKALT